MEEVIEWDEEGQPHIVERNKLLTPDLEMESLDLRDEATERMFRQSLRAMGVPISDERLMVGITFEFEDSLDEMSEEMIQKTVAQQMAKLQTYKILRAQGLSIPPDLKAEIEGGGEGAPGGAGGPGGGPGGPPGPLSVGAPMPGGMGGGMVMPPLPGGMGGGMFNPSMVPGGAAPAYPAMNPNRPMTAPSMSFERNAWPGRSHVASFHEVGWSGYSSARFTMRLAGVEDHELDEWEQMSDAEIEQRVIGLYQVIQDCRWRKKMRRTARENRELRTFEVEDGNLLKLSKTEKIVIDLVPPAFRRNILNGDYE
jgi:hypothetical protein